MISRRKNRLTFIRKTSCEIIKNIDNLVYNSSKSIKNLVTPKSNLINSCVFIKQIREFLKSSFDLIIKKYEELNKYMTNNLMMGLDAQLKDLSTDENLFTQFLNKFQKELNNFKANQTKLLQNKEKATQNNDKIKEQVIKSADDQTNFQKFEKQLIATMAEEDSAKEALADLNKKFKKFCEENFEFLKKTSEAYKEKEVLKNKEIKEQIFAIIKHKNKLINHILEFLEFKTQIQVDSETLIFSIEKIYLNFFKETAIEAFKNFEEKQFSELVKFLYSKNELENDLSLKKLLSSEENIPNLNITITSLIKKINFLNKDVSIYLRKESEYLSSSSSNSNNHPYGTSSSNNINNQIAENNQNPSYSSSTAGLKEDDLKVYYEKLNFLKTNSKKISVRHMFEPNRKRHEDIFYFDADEIINPNTFSCALSDKILLQGKLFITNKKLVFYSWFNNASLFGTTLIEIPKSDIVEVTKQYNMIFDNSIEVQTKNVKFFFTSFVYRDKCYTLIRENMLDETDEIIRKSILPNTELNLILNSNPAVILEKFDVLSSQQEILKKQLNAHLVPNANADGNIIGFEYNLNINNAKNNLKNININDTHCLLSDASLAEAANVEFDGSRKDEIANKVRESNKIKSLAQHEIPVEENKTSASNAQNQIKNNNSAASITLDSKNSNINRLLCENQNVNNQPKLGLSNEIINEENITQKVTKSFFDSELTRRLNELHQRNYETYSAKNKREYNTVCLKDKDLGDIPLPYVFNTLFNVDKTCSELNLNKCFLLSLMEIRKDYEIKLTKTANENWDSQTPAFYKANINNHTNDNNNNNSSCPFTDLFNCSPEKFSKMLIEDFTNSTFNFDASEQNKKNTLSFQYSLVHPILKKRFMGPSKLNIQDIFKVFFISPKCFIVENHSYLSGFMMMDCFFSVMQYKFESEFDFVARNSEGFLDSIRNKTKFTLSFGLEFVKTTMFKQKIIDNAIEDTHDFVKSCLFPTIDKAVQGQSKRFFEEKKMFAARANKEEALISAKPRATNIIDKFEENEVANSALEENINSNIQHEKHKENKIEENKNVEIIKEEVKLMENKEEVNYKINDHVAGRIDEKEAIIGEQEYSFIKMFFRENIYKFFFVICIILLISAKLEILNSYTTLVFLNLIGFAIVFTKLDAIERKINRN